MVHLTSAALPGPTQDVGSSCCCFSWEASVMSHWALATVLAGLWCAFASASVPLCCLYFFLRIRYFSPCNRWLKNTRTDDNFPTEAILEIHAIAIYTLLDSAGVTLDWFMTLYIIGFIRDLFLQKIPLCAHVITTLLVTECCLFPHKVKYLNSLLTFSDFTTAIWSIMSLNSSRYLAAGRNICLEKHSFDILVLLLREDLKLSLRWIRLKHMKYFQTHIIVYVCYNAVRGTSLDDQAMLFTSRSCWSLCKTNKRKTFAFQHQQNNHKGITVQYIPRGQPFLWEPNKLQPTTQEFIRLTYQALFTKYIGTNILQYVWSKAGSQWRPPGCQEARIATRLRYSTHS